MSSELDVPGYHKSYFFLKVRRVTWAWTSRVQYHQSYYLYLDIIWAVGSVPYRARPSSWNQKHSHLNNRDSLERQINIYKRSRGGNKLFVRGGGLLRIVQGQRGGVFNDLVWGEEDSKDIVP
jgi:hypothetical protein